jgi:hypothetical protein
MHSHVDSVQEFDQRQAGYSKAVLEEWAGYSSRILGPRRHLVFDALAGNWLSAVTRTSDFGIALDAAVPGETGFWG